MKVDLTQYQGPCSCGRVHSLLTREIIIEAGAMARLADLAATLGLNRRGVIICDTNTHPFAEGCNRVLEEYLVTRHSVIAMDAKGLHADEKAVSILGRILPEDTGWLLAVGSGTVHDITRYLAHDRGIPFISFPTAATVDGFVSTVSAMTWYGFKKTLPGVAPLAVVADTDVFAAAPYRLTVAGIGDALGKYTSLADWEAAHLATGEDFCSRIAAITREAVENVLHSLADIRTGSTQGMENLMFALLLSGIAMQMWGNSRPASGAEHHLSHLWEMECVSPHIDALHGEKVGVGLGLVLKEYHRMANLAGIKPYSICSGLPRDLLREKFGPLYDDIVTENTPDPLAGVDIDRLTAALPGIQRLLSALPDRLELMAKMAAAGCHTTVEQLGLDPDIIPDSINLSPYVRNRMTVMRMGKLLCLPQ